MTAITDYLCDPQFGCNHPNNCPRDIMSKLIIIYVLEFMTAFTDVHNNSRTCILYRKEVF